MTPTPAVSRRSLLKGGLALGATAGLATTGCAYIPSETTAKVTLPKSAKAKIDGDLIYFNWADYLDPSIFKGFQKEYGVKIIQSNFDSMEGMYAKLQAGNQYDIIFPIAKWVQKLRLEGKVRAIDHGQLINADQVFYSGCYYNDPWYDDKSAVSVPFTVYKTGIGWRTDKVDSMTGSWHDLWNPQAAKRIFTLDDQDEALAMAALLLGYDVNTSKPSRARRDQEAAVSQKKYLRAYSSDDVNNMARGDAWIHHMWSGDFAYLRDGVVKQAGELRLRGAQEGTPINSDAYCIPTNAKHPGTAMLFIDYLLRPEVAKKNIAYLYYPFPVKDAVPAVRRPGQGHPGRQRRRERPRELRRVPSPRRRRGAATGRHVDRSEGELDVATQEVTRPSAPATPPTRRRKSVQRTQLWGTLAGPADGLDRRLLRLEHGHRRAALLRPHPARRPPGLRHPADQLRRTVERGLPPAVPPLPELRRSRPRCICALIAYPVAYAIALHGGRFKSVLIAAIVVPFFASYLIRMYAWSALLSDDGVVNSALRKTGLGDGCSS